MMVIQVRVCGDLRRFMPGKTERLDLELPDGAPAGQVLDRLGIPDSEIWLVTVNGRQVSPEERLSSGDQVMVLAPVAGG